MGTRTALPVPQRGGYRYGVKTFSIAQKRATYATPLGAKQALVRFNRWIRKHGHSVRPPTHLLVNADTARRQFGHT